MQKNLLALALAAAMLVPLAAAPTDAHADGGRIFAGVVGGLAAGTILGAALAPRYYYPPPPVYLEPVDAPPPVSCRWAQGAPVWDGWRGEWVRPRVQVCE